MKKFYYLRNHENKPLVTICVISGRDGAATGVAICSGKDNPRKTTGKAIAEGRARKALKSKTNQDPVNRKNIWTMLTTLDNFWNKGFPFNFKSQYHTVM